MTPSLVIVFENPVPYGSIALFQDRLVTARQQDSIPDTVLLLEHNPVITMGIRAHSGNVLTPPDSLRQKGIDFTTSPRGGDVTYHAPGQLVLYPVMKLTGREADAHAYVALLEEVAIRTAGRFGIAAIRRSGKTGAWTAQGKVAAIGVKIRRWVTSHGMSFNVSPDLTGFDHIVPCGLHGEAVTSLQAILGPQCPTVASVRDTLLREFSLLAGRSLQPTNLESFGRDFGILPP